MSERSEHRSMRRPLVVTLVAVGAVLVGSSPARGVGGLLAPVTTTTVPSLSDVVGTVTTLPVPTTLPSTTLPPATLPTTTLPKTTLVPTTLPDAGGVENDLQTGLDVDGALDGGLGGLLGDGPTGGGGAGGGGDDGGGSLGDLVDGGAGDATGAGDGLVDAVVRRVLGLPVDAGSTVMSSLATAGGDGAAPEGAGRDRGDASETARRSSASETLGRDVARVVGSPTPPAARLRSAHLVRVATGAARDFGFPLLLALLVVLFLFVQGWLDRRDPKLAAAPLSSEDDLLGFR